MEFYPYKLEFFINRFKGFNVPFYLPIPFMLCKIIGTVCVMYYGNLQNLKNRFLVSITLSGLFMVFIALLAAFIPTQLGFYLSLVVVSLLGISNAVYNSSCNGYVSMFPGKYQAKYFFGNGLGVLLLNMFGAIFLLIFDSNETSMIISSVSYFLVAGILLVVCYFLFQVFQQTDFAQYYLMKGRIKSQVQQNLLKQSFEVQTEINQTLDITNQQQIIIQKFEQNNELITQETKLNIKTIFEIVQILYPYPILLFILFVQTFMMFPGLTVKQKLKFIPEKYNIIFILFFYNLCDTFGKYMSNHHLFQTLIFIKVGIFSRFLLFVVFLLVVSKPDTHIIGTDICILLNTGTFAVSNGFFNGALFILASQKGQGKFKELSGIIMLFCLLTGITTGTFMALIFRNLGE